ncbi:MAG: peptidoglycan-associated lipoprotein Pal [candidate division NC10 bacterium]|nr:peptidoglycan-associated lipoprotein Pal [candidate division NC10 bacterium]
MGEVAPGAIAPAAKAPEKPPAVVEKAKVPEAAPKVTEEVVKKPAEIKEAAVRPAEVPKEAVPKVSPLEDVFFDTDLALLREDAKKSLQVNAEWLKANPKATITLEGHCDERGTVEYNLGLGERRAKAAKDFLVSLGISADRIKTISYGKERPFVLGHDESAWKWNRRAHFVIKP